MNLNVNKTSNCNDEFFGGSSTTPEIISGLPSSLKEGTASICNNLPTTSMLLKNFFAVLSVITTEFISLNAVLGLPRNNGKVKTSKKFSSTNKENRFRVLLSAETLT